VKDLDPLGSSRPRQLMGWNDTLLFSAHTEVGEELWKSDGAAAGTVLVKDLVPGGEDDSSFPSAFTAGPAGVFFVARGAAGETELWRTDGTGTGTQRVVVLSGETFDPLGSYARIVPFGAQTLVFTQRVWVSDGTQAGTRALAAAPSVDAIFTWPLTLGGAVYFAAAGPEQEPILWRTDGTEAGTFPLLDANGNTLERPRSLRAFAGSLVFAVYQNERNALWTSDGTAAGTRRVSLLGQIRELAVAGPRLFFTAPSREHGEELWALPEH
jgi:ELWxxDGT repeat protein